MTCAQPFRRLLDLPSDIVEYGFVQEWVEMTHASVFTLYGQAVYPLVPYHHTRKTQTIHRKNCTPADF